MLNNRFPSRSGILHACRSIVTCSVFTTLLLCSSSGYAQWLDWQDDSGIRLILSSVAYSDGEEKDMWPADLNNDGDMDLIVVRKEPFSNSTQPGKSNLLLMNNNGIMVDQTSVYAPEFLTTVNFARDVFVADFDGDSWQDVIIANTFGQQPMYYRNLGNNTQGNWLGLVNESSTRFPVLTDDTPLFCAVWGGDVTGDGHKDIYFVNYKPNSAGGTAQDFLLINNGLGVFTNESQTRLGILRNSAFGTAVQIADMDNDGDNDIVKNTTLYNVAPWNARGVIVLFNNGSGTFTTWQNLVPVGSPYMFEIADFNLDGKKDLYVVDDGSDYILTVTAFTVNTSLTFTKTNLNFASSNGFGGNVHAADLDLDGDMDIGVADVDVDIPPCNSSRRMAIYKNNGGVFQDVYGSTLFPWADNSYDFAWLDINNDGLMDFITGFCAGYGVLMNDNCALAPNPSDYDQDGLADACDPCPTNPDTACAPPTNYPTVDTSYSIARQWNELLLASIRRDFARPTVHARNLFHISAAMWDAWSVYDSTSCEFLLGQTVDGFTCPFTGIPFSSDVTNDRKKAITYAAYRLLKHRFANSPQAALLNQAYDVHMDTLGYDKTFTSVNYATGDARALGNYIAQCYINFGLQDGSNEQNGYANTSYTPVNPALNVDVPGNPNIVDLNRWQPLTLDLFIDQSGNQIPGATPPFLSPEWGQVSPFALNSTDLTTYQRNGFNYNVYHDMGSPPLIDSTGGGNSDAYKFGFALVSVWSSHLSPSDSVMWDISPATQGNRDTLPASYSGYPDFYNLITGGTDNVGHSINPKTGLPYAPNIVPRGDYARVLAEFWADGPDSETPPGHWFTLFNYITDHPAQTRQYQGTGTPLNPLEWDVKGYLALGGAMHDVAISIWGAKGWYDYIRPLSAIRAMAANGQSTNAALPSYSPLGIPLVPGYIELVASGDSLQGPGGANIGKIKLYAWKGHDYINNVDADEAGVGWILAENWMPYQRPTFVTPPFAGYISGHSTYSRAAAEILEAFTGDPYFPGGLGEFTADENEFLVFEDGPSQDITLQWATYQDAADESSLSRIWGGIHPPCDDIPGRLVAPVIAENAFEMAEKLFFNIPNDGICDVPGCTDPSACNYSSLATQGNGSCIYAANYYLDGDGDGYGTTQVDTFSCAAPVGYVPVAGDCDDANNSIHPGATEICCNGIDENCNNVIDDGNCGNLPNISSANVTYPTVACDNTLITVTVNPIPGATAYIWTTTQGALINGQPSPATTATNSVGIQLGTLPTGVSRWDICVKAINGCDTTNTVCKSVRGRVSTPSIITGSTIACENTSSNYSINAVTYANTYYWSGTGGITVTGSGTSAVAQFPAAFTSGTVCVQAGFTCGYLGNPKCITVKNTTATPGTITGPTPVCPGSSGLPYSVQPVSGAVSYNWTTPNNMTLATGAGTNAVTADVGTAFTSGKICVTSTSACGVPSASRCKSLSSAKPATPGSISGTATGVCGTTVTYTVPQVNGVTYNWTPPLGATLASPNGTNTVSVSYPGNYTTGSLCVAAVNSCGQSTARCLIVKGAPDRPQAISGPAVVCPFATGVTYSIAPVAGASPSGYVWGTPSGSVIVAGQGTTSITMNWGGSAGSVWVKASNSCGLSASRTLVVSHNCKVSANTLPGTRVLAYPNPASEILYVELTTDLPGKYNLELLDVSGRLVLRESLEVNSGRNNHTLYVGKLPAGMYLLRVMDAHRFSQEIQVAID